jgi:signal transduction histidine kinase/HPt (histidine-containing phosphotransfer) domain-containing protein/ActR/RegA family two-component response regulator
LANSGRRASARAPTSQHSPRRPRPRRRPRRRALAWRERDAVLVGLALLGLLFLAQNLAHELLRVRPNVAVYFMPIVLAAVLGGRRSGLLVTACSLALVAAFEPSRSGLMPSEAAIAQGWRLAVLGLTGAIASMVGGALRAYQRDQQAAWRDRRAADRQQRETEAARSFLLGLQDALRRPGDPAEGLVWALRMLMDRVGAAGVGYAEYEPEGSHALVDPAQVVGMAELAGRHRPLDFGTLAASRLRDGHTVVYHDTAHSPELSDADRAAYARLGVGAIVKVPELDGECLARVLFIVSREPRRWSESEVRLIEDAAARISADARRVRAERLAVERMRELEASRDRMARAEEAARVSTWSYDLRAREFNWPEGTVPLLGEVLGERLRHWSGWRDLIHPDDLARVEGSLREALRRRGPLDLRFRLRLPEGALRWLQVRADVVIGDRGEPVQLIGLTMDVTDQERLRAASASKSAFLANMSHEIRTPLSVIVGLTERLRRRAHDVGDSRLLDQLRDTSEHLLQVINDILDLSKIEAGQLQLADAPFALADVLNRTHRLFEDAAARKHLALIVDASPEAFALVLRGDALRLSQVLINLCSNAIKFTPAGRIVIGAQALAAAPGRSRLRLSVTDTGIGIEPNLRQRLFEPFVQGDESASRKAGGTGLGLAICKRIADRIGGSLEVESQPGQGSVFRLEVELPRVDLAPEAVAPDDQGEAIRTAVGEAAPDPGAPGVAYPGRRVLLVEDHPLSQEIVTEMLEELGCDVVLAGDGIEAVDLASIGRFDLILMDLQLPSLDGYGAARLIRLLPPHHDTPIVALSANAFREDRERALEAGMTEHLAKPLSRAALAALFARQLGPAAEGADRAVSPEPALLAAVARLPGVVAPASWRGSQRTLWDFGQLLRHLLESLDDDLAQMRARIARGERDDARALAHRAAGAASLTGATGIAAALVMLEQALDGPVDAADAGGLLGDVERRMDELRAALETLPAGGALSPASAPGP